MGREAGKTRRSDSARSRPSRLLAAIVSGVPSPQELEQRIATALPGAQVSVEDLTGGGDHFRAEVISEQFEGLSRIAQHQLVYGVFGDEVGGAIHALSIKTSTP
jgi:stress-induced morphogen